MEDRLTAPPDTLTGEERRPLALIYARVSTDRQAERGLSLDEQIRLAVERCESEGWAHEVRADAGWSGAKWERPDLQALRADLGRADFVVVWKLDRLTRSMAHLSRLLDEFKAQDVGLVSLTEPFDGSTAMGRAMMEIGGVFAQLERSHNAERVRASAAPRVLKRQLPYGGARRMYGRNRDYSIRPAEAEVLRQRIVPMMLAGEGELAVARSLNAAGISSASGGRWHDSVIGRLVRKPHLPGDVVVPGTGEVLRDVLEPIIERDTWDRLQAFLEARAARSGRGRGRKPAQATLLRGLVSCGLCDGEVVVRKERDGAMRYVCKRRLKDGIDACPQPSIRRELLDGPVFAWVERDLLDVASIQAGVEKASRLAVADARATAREADRESSKLTAQLQRVKRDYREERLTAAEYREERTEIEVDLGAAQAEALRLRDRVAELEADGALVDAQALTLRYLTQLRETVERGDGLDALNAALSQVIETFVLGDLDDVRTLHAVIPEGVREGDTVDFAVSLIAVGEGRRFLQPIARDGHFARPVAGLAVERPRAIPLHAYGNKSVDTSQKTSLRPRRTIRSSSYPPAQTLAPRMR